jgi:hypothetical protein
MSAQPQAPDGSARRARGPTAAQDHDEPPKPIKFRFWRSGYPACGWLVTEVDAGVAVARLQQMLNDPDPFGG